MLPFVVLLFALMAAAGKKKKGGKKKASNQIVPYSQPFAAGSTFGHNRSSRTHTSRINGREMSSILTSSVLTEISPLEISPTYEGIFPLTSKDAIRFAAYKPHKLCFHLKTHRAVTAEGLWGIAWQPNADITALPESFQVMENYEYCVFGPVYKDLTLNIPMSALLRREYQMRQAAADAPVQSRNLYAMGRVYLFTSGGDGKTCGQFGVEYDFTFEGQFAPNNIELTSYYIKSGAATDNAHLLTGTTTSTENSYSELERVPVEISTGPSVVRDMLVPTTESESTIRMKVSGTGFDGTTNLTAGLGTNKLITAGFEVLNYLKGTTEIFTEFVVACLGSASEYITGAIGSPLDWIDIGMGGTIGSITGYTISVFPTIANVAFKSLPLLLAFQDHPLAPVLQNHWIRLRTQKLSAQSDPIIGPIVRDQLRFAHTGMRFLNLDDHLGHVMRTVNSIPQQVQMEFHKLALDKGVIGILIPEQRVLQPASVAKSSSPPSLAGAATRPLSVPRIVELQQGDDDSEVELPSSYDEVQRAVDAYNVAVSTFGSASPKARQAMFAVISVTRGRQLPPDASREAASKGLSSGHHIPYPASAFCQACGNPLCDCKVCHKCERE